MLVRSFHLTLCVCVRACAVHACMHACHSVTCIQRRHGRGTQHSMVVAHSTPWSWHTALHGRGTQHSMVVAHSTPWSWHGPVLSYWHHLWSVWWHIRVHHVCWLIVEYVPFLFVDCLRHNFSLPLHCMPVMATPRLWICSSVIKVWWNACLERCLVINGAVGNDMLCVYAIHIYLRMYSSVFQFYVVHYQHYSCSLPTHMHIHM